MSEENKNLNTAEETQETVAVLEKEETQQAEENPKKKKKQKKYRENIDAVELDIDEDDIWTYQVEGLSPPAVNVPVKNRLVKQIIFVVVIVIAIAISIYFSVRAVHRDTFEYNQLDNGYEMTAFSNTGYIKEITLNYMLDITYDENETDLEKNFSINEDTSKPVTEIHEFAFNCDNVLQTINIGPNVEVLDNDSFYSCWELRCINVDENNPNYSSVDGVLYNKDKTEIICYPIKHSEYLKEKYGYTEAVEPDAEGYDEYREKVLTYVVEPTVTTIGELCFNYTDLTDVYLPEGLKTIETMSFFKSGTLANIYTYAGDISNSYVSLPESVEYIGSDAFSYDQSLTYMYIPKNVTYLGHHAFWECVYKEDGNLKGLAEINVEISEKQLDEQCHYGDQWRAEYDYMLFKKKIPVNYSVERITEMPTQ